MLNLTIIGVNPTPEGTFSLLIVVSLVYFINWIYNKLKKEVDNYEIE